MGDIQPIVKLIKNPWEGILPNSRLYEIFGIAARRADEQLAEWIHAGDVEEDRTSYGGVILDPTLINDGLGPCARVMVTIELGPNGLKYLPNGLAKADAGWRHGRNTADIFENSLHLLGSGDFAWPPSVCYDNVYGGGSGLSVEQDEELMGLMLVYAVPQIRREMESWIKDMRARHGSWGWFTSDNQPPAHYDAVRALLALPANDDD